MVHDRDTYSIHNVWSCQVASILWNLVVTTFVNRQCFPCLQDTKVGQEQATGSFQQAKEVDVRGQCKDEVFQRHLAWELNVGDALSPVSKHYRWQKLRFHKGILLLIIVTCESGKKWRHLMICMSMCTTPHAEFWAKVDGGCGSSFKSAAVAWEVFSFMVLCVFETNYSWIWLCYVIIHLQILFWGGSNW